VQPTAGFERIKQYETVLPEFEKHKCSKPNQKPRGSQSSGDLPTGPIPLSSYTNNFALTVPPAFDQVGFMGGRALFNAASTSAGISFKDVTVTLSKHHDAP
jgi:hypothetical protein